LGAPYHGAFNGLFYVPPELVTNEIAFDSAGMLKNLVLGNHGSFSGNLLLAGGSYALNGAFDAFGHVTNYVVDRSEERGGPLILDMDLDTNGDGIITGSVSNASWPTNAYLWAYLSTPGQGASNYTMLMETSTNAANGAVPPGYGYALIADHGGAVTLSGGLADGTTFNQTVPASPSNDVPIYVSLYNKTGFLYGWLNLTNLANTNAAQELLWIKGTPAKPGPLFPAGFTNWLTTQGSLWTNPGVITLSSNNILTISNTDFDLDYTVAITPPNKLANSTSAPTNTLAGSINLTNGLLKVTFGNGDGKKTTQGYGALLQDTMNAGGYFIFGTNAGTITLQP
jgi:hypothetical protein